MTGWERVSADAFDRAVTEGAASAAFRERYDRYDSFMPPEIVPSFDGWAGSDFNVHRGNLILAGNFTAPGPATLILGNLTVGGYVDVVSDDPQQSQDEHGLFIVLGDVRCCVFSGGSGVCSFVDGDLVAKDLLLNAYEDSSLLVTGHLRTRFFLGYDIRAEVGAGADMDYGIGYAVPLGADAQFSAIQPRHGKAASLALLADRDPEFLENLYSWELMERVRAGQPIFR